MPESFRRGKPNDVLAILDQYQWQGPELDEDKIEFQNLFNEERIRDSTESIFLLSEDGRVVALALIDTIYRNIFSYYTLPQYRGHKHGYRLLVECIRRITEATDDLPGQIKIELTSPGAVNNFNALPENLRQRLRPLSFE